MILNQQVIVYGGFVLLVLLYSTKLYCVWWITSMLSKCIWEHGLLLDLHCKQLQLSPLMLELKAFSLAWPIFSKGCVITRRGAYTICCWPVATRGYYSIGFYLRYVESISKKEHVYRYTILISCGHGKYDVCKRYFGLAHGFPFT